MDQILADCRIFSSARTGPIVGYLENILRDGGTFTLSVCLPSRTRWAGLSACMQNS